MFHFYLKLGSCINKRTWIDGPPAKTANVSSDLLLGLALALSTYPTSGTPGTEPKFKAECGMLWHGVGWWKRVEVTITH